MIFEGMKPRRNVLQDWVSELSFMQQTVLLTAVRGPDGIGKTHPVKHLLRYFRRTILYSAFESHEHGKPVILDNPYEDGGGSFTGMVGLDLDVLVDKYMASVDEMPLHFHMHLVHASEIVGYKHPYKDTRKFWRTFYETCCRGLHMIPEPEMEMDSRLGGVYEEWSSRDVVPLDNRAVSS
jgi:hypothetical protein